jgi:LysR family transcriptional regulator, transcription activator of glutamate synthase operon
MNIEQLEHIVEVAKTGSISVASKTLNISQSGISRSIKKFEEEIGIKLFKRSKAGTIITDEGKPIIKKAYEIIIKLKEFNDSIQLQTSLMEKELKIAASPSLFLTVLLTALSKFNNDYSDINIDIKEKSSNLIMEDVLQNKIDFGLTVINDKIRNEEAIVSEVIMEGKICIGVSKHSPLAFSETVDPGDLRDQKLIVYDGVNMNMFVDEFFKTHGAIPILFRSNNTEVIKRAVVEGVAISFFTNLALQNDPYVQNGDLVPIPLTKCDFITVPFGWIRSRKDYFSNTAREFLKYIY